jgi:hypothetical protein
VAIRHRRQLKSQAASRISDANLRIIPPTDGIIEGDE